MCGRLAGHPHTHPDVVRALRVAPPRVSPRELSTTTWRGGRMSRRGSELRSSGPCGPFDGALGRCAQEERGDQVGQVVGPDLIAD